MRVHVLANPAARGTGARDHERVVALLGAAGHDVEDITADSRERSLAAARAAVETGSARLVVVGGDGLVHVAVQAVAGSCTPIGLVPQGTGNDFARALGLLDLGVDGAVEAAVADPVPVDAMRTTHGWGVSVATLGFAGDVTARANAMRWPKGEARYSVATVLQLPRLRQLTVQASIDDQPMLDVQTTMLSIGNTAYFGGGMKVCPHADPRDGEFEMAVVGNVPRRTFLRVFPKVFGGTHVGHPEVSIHRGRRIRLDSGSVPVDLWADGELLGPLPVDVEVVPGALMVAGAFPTT